MEQIIETVTVTSKEGGVAIFDITLNPGVWQGARACIRDSSGYYDIDVFERGLASGKAAKVERVAR